MAFSYIQRGGQRHIKAWNAHMKIGFRGPITKLANLWAQEMKKRDRDDDAPRTNADFKILKAAVVSCLERGEKPEDVGKAQQPVEGYPTMMQVFDAYEVYRRREAKLQDRPFNEKSGNYQTARRLSRDHFGKLRPDAIAKVGANGLTPVETFIDKYVERGLKRQSGHQVFVLYTKQACAWAAAQNPPIMWNPFGKYAFRVSTRGPGRKERCLPDREALLLAGCKGIGASSWLEDFIIMAIDLGAREAENICLRYSEIDWEHCIITFPKTKRGEERKVPFNPNGRVAKILKRGHRYQFQSTAYVLDLPGAAAKSKDKDKARIKLVQRAFANLLYHVFCGVERRYAQATPRKNSPLWKQWRAINLTIHDLRHEAITWMGEQRVPESVCDWLVGHVSQKMHGRYDHSKERMAREYLEECVWPAEEKRAKVGTILSQSAPKSRKR